MAPSAGKKVGSVRRGLAELAHALNVPEPLKNHRGCKPPILIDNLELINFPANILAWAEFAQLLFMTALLTQLTVVKLTIDLRTPAQYDGLTAIAAADKGKQRAVPAIEDDSNYGQSQSKEEEAKEGKLAAQRFQHVQRNKKLTKKKVNRAKAAAAIVHKAPNNFSGCIPDGLGVKFTCRGFPGTPYKLEQLYKYYSNLHVPCCDCIVAYMLLSELKNFTQCCNMALHDRTMTLLCSDPAYWDLVNPMQGPEDLSFAEKCHIPSRFLRVKDDRSTTLCVMCTPDPNVPFDLDQLVQYVLIFGRPGMENTWQGIAVNFAYHMHW
ncbi:hypothetical protein C0992_003333 [Termitomyces sp. T32_za158]|nr:hypothetical protein C0992_003333 [Termitomyces sp. T32_za158]